MQNDDVLSKFTMWLTDHNTNIEVSRTNPAHCTNEQLGLVVKRQNETCGYWIPANMQAMRDFMNY